MALKSFHRKSVLIRAATADTENENNIRIMLTQRLQFIDQNETQLANEIKKIEYYIRYPDKLPEELRNLIATAREPVTTSSLSTR